MVPIYPDYNATPRSAGSSGGHAPVSARAFGNPLSCHAYGNAPREAVAEVRKETARLIGARPAEIIFAGSAAEANNLALLGLTRTLGNARRHAVISAVEHPAVTEPANNEIAAPAGAWRELIASGEHG